jgi:hypothetical protein
MDITEDLNNINNFIKYLSLVSENVSNKAQENKRISIQEYKIIKDLSKLITNYFNNNDIDSDNEVDFLDDVEIEDPILSKLKDNELSKENLIAQNKNLDRSSVIFNLNCYNY